MASGRYREEVFNVLLALLLHQQGVITAPEQSLRQVVQSQSRRHIPDILVSFQGLRTAIEGKVADQQDAAERAFTEAKERVNKGIAHIGIAVIYPAALRQIPFESLSDTIANSKLQIAVCSEAGETGWAEGGLDYLADLLRRTFHQLVQEDVVTRTVEVLSSGVNEFARHAFNSPATVRRAAEILGVGEPPHRTRRQQENNEE